MLTVKNLSFEYLDDPKILCEISFSLKQGEIASLIGVSGSGKSTLFKLITGILSTKRGEIFVGGNQIPAENNQISYMMQEDLLLPWRSVIENMVLHFELGNDSTSLKSVKEKAYNLLNEFGLGDHSDMYPDSLSVGMRQRVSLARAILEKRPLLLLDEPFAALDIIFREQLYTFLDEIRKKQNISIFMVTHDFRDALSMSDKIFLLKEGKITREWLISEEERKCPKRKALLAEEMKLAMES